MTPNTAKKTMKPFLSALIFVVTVFSMFAAETNITSPSIAPDSRCFELRTYYAAPGKLENRGEKKDN